MWSRLSRLTRRIFTAAPPAASGTSLRAHTAPSARGFRLVLLALGGLILGSCAPLVTGYDSGPVCFYDSECGPNTYCASDGQCYGVSGCSSHDDCAQGDQCTSSGACVSSGGCSYDAECPGGQYCAANGACYSVPGCSSDGDCPEGAYCANDGVCYYSR